jgi:hypothetical protein
MKDGLPKLVLPPEYIDGLIINIHPQSQMERVTVKDYTWYFPYYLAMWRHRSKRMHYLAKPITKIIDMPGLWTKGFDVVLDEKAMLIDIRDNIRKIMNGSGIK